MRHTQYSVSSSENGMFIFLQPTSRTSAHSWHRQPHLFNMMLLIINFLIFNKTLNKRAVCLWCSYSLVRSYATFRISFPPLQNFEGLQATSSKIFRAAQVISLNIQFHFHPKWSIVIFGLHLTEFPICLEHFSFSASKILFSGFAFPFTCIFYFYIESGLANSDYKMISWISLLWISEWNAIWKKYKIKTATMEL